MVAIFTIILGLNEGVLILIPNLLNKIKLSHVSNISFNFIHMLTSKKTSRVGSSLDLTVKNIKFSQTVYVLLIFCFVWSIFSLYVIRGKKHTFRLTKMAFSV